MAERADQLMTDRATQGLAQEAMLESPEPVTSPWGSMTQQQGVQSDAPPPHQDLSRSKDRGTGSQRPVPEDPQALFVMDRRVRVV